MSKKNGKHTSPNSKNGKTLKIAIPLFVIAIALVLFVVLKQNTNLFNFIGETERQSVEEQAETREETQVFEDGSAMLTDDSAIVSSVAIVNKVTGTGPFDENDEPGNDSSATNNIVRSFDTVTYELEANMSVNNTGHGSEDANTYASFRGGVIYVEATIPEENAGLMKWSIDDMTWANGTGVLSDDGLTFTAQYQMDDDKITVPGKQTISLVLKVEGAGNGNTFAPTFKLWMQGNESNKENEGYEAVEITDEEPVTISAKAGFNIKIVRSIQKKVNVDFGNGKGTVTGRIYGYNIILQLYNADVEKGLKGLEYPQGDITFDIETKLETVETIDGKQVTTDITDLATPRLWNYKINIGSENDNPAYGNIPDRNMAFGKITSFYSHNSPYGIYDQDRLDTSYLDSIYNSGNILPCSSISIFPELYIESKYDVFNLSWS